MSINLPAIYENGLTAYLQEIKAFPILTLEQETDLMTKWLNHGDISAANALVTSHLRLVASIAMEYKRYGIPIMDLISEGVMGLIQAVHKFNPDLGCRLATYASWWIKSFIQEYILKYMQVGTSAMQKSLFFNINKLKHKKIAVEGSSNVDFADLAAEFNVSERDIIEMQNKLIGMENLNKTIDENDGTEAVDMLTDHNASHEGCIMDADEMYKKAKIAKTGFEKVLNDREKRFLYARFKLDHTLEDISKAEGVSKERVRQICNRAIEKLQAYARTEAEAI